MKTSIVITNYNGLKLLKKNLPEVVKAVSNSEIIIVDDASTDGSVRFVKNNFPNIKIIENSKNLRFAASCNKGVKEAKGEIVILLNNDVRPTKNFLNPLVNNFRDPLVFSVGCKEIEIRKNRKIVSGRTEGEFKKGFLVHRKAKDQTKKQTLWTFGGSMAVNRQKFLKLNGFDSLFKPAYWEDIDLCWRARKKAWKILFEPQAVVYHQHETTNIKELGKRNMEIAAYKNQILFVWKNIRGVNLILHFVWLPYHLLLTSLRSRGLFLIGFYKAVSEFILKGLRLQNKPG
jgi:GT2 family glycosyltransferase